MKIKVRVIALILILSLISATVGCFSDTVSASAAESVVKFEKSKLTLRPGNIYQTKVEGLYDEGWGPYATYTSSDPAVAKVGYYGLITAVAPGTCTIKVEDYYTGNKATMKVTVKEGTVRLSPNEISIYSGQETELDLIHDKNADYYTYDIESLDGSSAYGGLSVNAQYDGRYLIKGLTSGTYRFAAILVDTDGQRWSATTTVTVLGCGPEYTKKSLAVGQTIDLSDEACTLEEIYVPHEAKNEWYYIYGNYNGYDYRYTSEHDQDCIALSGKTIRAAYEGTAFMLLFYRTPDGDQIVKELTIIVTDPKLKSVLPEYLLSNRNYEASDFIEGTSSRSEITILSSDHKIVEDPGSYSYIYVIGTGEVELTFVVDGKKLKTKINCYNPKVSSDSLLIKKGKTKTIKVTGIPDSITTKFKSSNKSIATVSSSGKVTAKKNGYAEITVTCGNDISFSVMVCVAKAKAVDVVLQGEKLIGWKYDQDLRMKEGYADCSAFVWKAYHKAGVDLKSSTYAPTAADLAKYLDEQGKAIAYEYIEASKLQPGDLIFYGGSSNGRYKNIYHAAMYAGPAKYYDWWYGEEIMDGYIIHATSPSVNKTYYSGYATGNIVMIARPLK